MEELPLEAAVEDFQRALGQVVELTHQPLLHEESIPFGSSGDEVPSRVPSFNHSTSSSSKISAPNAASTTQGSRTTTTDSPPTGDEYPPPFAAMARSVSVLQSLHHTLAAHSRGALSSTEDTPRDEDAIGNEREPSRSKSFSTADTRTAALPKSAAMINQRYRQPFEPSLSKISSSRASAAGPSTSGSTTPGFARFFSSQDDDERDRLSVGTGSVSRTSSILAPAAAKASEFLRNQRFSQARVQSIGMMSPSSKSVDVHPQSDNVPHGWSLSSAMWDRLAGMRTNNASAGHRPISVPVIGVRGPKCISAELAEQFPTAVWRSTSVFHKGGLNNHGRRMSSYYGHNMWDMSVTHDSKTLRNTTLNATRTAFGVSDSSLDGDDNHTPGHSASKLSLASSNSAVMERLYASLMSQRPDIPKWKIDPTGNSYLWWTLWIMVVILYFFVVTPIRLAFGIHSSGVMLWVEFVLDMFLLVDFVCNFVCGKPLEDGRITFDCREVTMAYLKGWLFWDIATVTPLEWLIILTAGTSSSGRTVANWLRLIRLAWIPRLFSRLRMGRLLSDIILSMGNGSYRLFKFCMIVIGMAHIIACCWVYIETNAAASQGTWLDAYAQTQSIENLSKTQTYITALYFSVTTMTSVGFGDIVPVTNIEKAFTILCMLLTSTGFAFFTANIAAILTSLDSTADLFFDRMRAVAAFMSQQKVSTELRDRILEYFQFVYLKRNYTDLNVISDLSDALKNEVILYLNREMVEAVPFFEGGHPSFIRSIMMRLRPALYAPGDLIICEGDLGRHMFFIKSGVAQAVSGDGKRVYKELCAGDFFGELALLLSARRTASVRAVTYCDVFSLSRRDLAAILLDFPDTAEYMKKFAQQAQYKFHANSRQSMKAGWRRFSQALTNSKEDGSRGVLSFGGVKKFGAYNRYLTFRAEPDDLNSFAPL